MQGRRAKLHLLYNSRDISEDISADLDSATWTDKSDKSADELSINLHNAHGKWSGDWLPAKGAKLTASIEVLNWGEEGNNSTLPCGTFEIDQIEVSGGSSGSKATIKALSVPITSQARGSKKTKAWEVVKLSVIAAEIARNAGLSLFFELDEDPEYQREDQLEETDLNFLQGLCAEAGASLKVTHDKIVVFSREKREQEDSVLIVSPQMLSDYRFTSKSNKVYAGARVEYHDPETDEDYEFEYEEEGSNLSGEDQNVRILVMNEEVKSLAEAERLAKNSLRDNNKFEVTGSFSCIGDVRLVAGVNVQMAGFGRFDGKYVIDTATHTIGAGYKVTVQTRRAMIKSVEKTSEPGWRDFSAYGEDYYK
jgi:phage protein D